MILRATGSNGLILWICSGLASQVSYNSLNGILLLLRGWSFITSERAPAILLGSHFKILSDLGGTFSYMGVLPEG